MSTTEYTGAFVDEPCYDFITLYPSFIICRRELLDTEEISVNTKFEINSLGDMPSLEPIYYENAEIVHKMFNT